MKHSCSRVYLLMSTVDIQSQVLLSATRTGYQRGTGSSSFCIIIISFFSITFALALA